MAIIWDLSKVVIAQIHGYCLAGASEMASMCDLLVTTPDCEIGIPPMRSMGVDMLWFPWLLPMRKATEMAVTGDNITGEEAYRLGMANYCVPEEDIDEFTQECLSLHVARRIRSGDVLDQLYELFLKRGMPQYIRSDNVLSLESSSFSG